MKTAIVSGAARGIGLATATCLVEKGYQVVLVDILEMVHASAQELDEPARVYARVVDVRDHTQVQALMEEVVRRFTTIDVLVNAAGTNHRSAFAELTLDDWRMDVDTNMTGTFLMCQAAVFPHMKAQMFGRIVNIASVGGKAGGIGPIHEDGSGGRSGLAYAASKAGVINLTKWIAKDVGKWGITCNTILPGPIVTEMTRGHQYDMSDVPVGRWGEPREVADAVEFLVRDQSSFITGTTLHVDGGILMA